MEEPMHPITHKIMKQDKTTNNLQKKEISVQTFAKSKKIMVQESFLGSLNEYNPSFNQIISDFTLIFQSQILNYLSFFTFLTKFGSFLWLLK